MMLWRVVLWPLNGDCFTTFGFCLFAFPLLFMRLSSKGREQRTQHSSTHDILINYWFIYIANVHAEQRNAWCSISQRKKEKHVVYVHSYFQ